MSGTEYKKVPIEDKAPVEDVEKHCDPDEKEKVKYGYGVRHIQALLCFMCLTLGYTSRGHLAVTIVAMTMGTHSDHDSPLTNINDTLQTINDTMIYPMTEVNTESYVGNFTGVDDVNDNMTVGTNETNSNDSAVYRTYNWPKSVQETILGAFFLGYSLMMFPSGIICQRWGGKVLLQAAMFVNAVVSFLTPWLIALGGWKTLCVLRVLQGLSQSGLYPAIQTLLSSWIPFSERASISSYVFTASGIGTVIAFQSAGILALSVFGWPSTFWATGAACSIGFVLITWFGADTPEAHKSISDGEKEYILDDLKENVGKKTKVPWKSVLKSLPVWATITTHIGNALCFIFFFVEVPTYMYAVLKVNIRNSGLLSSLPYLASFFSSVAFGYLSDYLTDKRNVSVKTARKLFNSIASVIPAISIIMASYTTNTTVAVILFIVFFSSNVGMHTSWLINYMDLSPNYSGAIMAFGNTLTNFLVLALPVLISYIITDVTNQYQWRIAMTLMASLTFLGNIVFVLFMSADVQPWNNSSDGSSSSEDKNEPEPEKIELKQ